ncbi:MAG: four-helix bundle copper-binding protein, partial [Aureliella sp.]
ETLSTCLDCADICAAASQVVARGGPFAKLICAACADACQKCAAACEKFPADEHMAKCAAECRQCEAACRKMI